MFLLGVYSSEIYRQDIQTDTLPDGLGWMFWWDYLDWNCMGGGICLVGFVWNLGKCVFLDLFLVMAKKTRYPNKQILDK